MQFALQLAFNLIMLIANVILHIKFDFNSIIIL